STLKGYLLFNDAESKSEEISGWKRNPNDPPVVYNNDSKTFSLRIPLKFWFNLFSDYQHVLFVKHKFRFIRSRTDNNCYVSTDTKTATITLTNVELQVTHVVPNDMIKLKLLEGINQNTPIRVPFRRWELHELLSLRETKKEIWQIGTSPNVE